jgi:PAS domain S-box-containing protein
MGLGMREGTFERMFELASIGMAVTDAAGGWVRVNPAFARILGVPREELAGMRLADFLDPEELAADTKHARELGTDQFFEVDRLFQRPDGSEAWLRLAFAPIDDNFMVQARDVTDHHEINAQLVRSNRELEEFASVASHDLQEPLRKIQAFADRMSDGRGDRTDNLARIKSAAQRMQTLIDDFLAYARLKHKDPTFATADVQALIKDLVKDLDTRGALEGVEVDVSELPELEIDAGQVEQLFQNLLENALKFRREDVPLRVHVAVAPQALAAYATIVFGDNGIGFEKKYAEKIFSIFGRLHGNNEYAGTGIGLAMCRTIVERHGGTIRAESESGTGAQFFITLPRTQRGLSPRVAVAHA